MKELFGELRGYVVFVAMVVMVAAPMYLALAAVTLLDIGRPKYGGLTLVWLPPVLMLAWLAAVILWGDFVSKSHVGQFLGEALELVVQVSAMALIGVLLVEPLPAVLVFGATALVSFLLLYWLYGKIPTPEGDDR
ncbi:hypothetical protein [Actinomyces ruminis]|uniref:hypothetical protein n=1 Tax=Actinomyces ruminis TaxID=1937003 RepID=UPI0011781C3D|nr:hypothetical protein [Actinomyces ruminis]